MLSGEERTEYIDNILDDYEFCKITKITQNQPLKSFMSYSPNLLKNLGIKLAMDVLRKEKRPAEIRLFSSYTAAGF
jgi:hypothetical protein